MTSSVSSSLQPFQCPGTHLGPTGEALRVASQEDGESDLVSYMYFGAALLLGLLARKEERDDFDIGEFVGIQLSPESGFVLSFVRKVLDATTIECSTLDPFHTIEVPASKVRKLRPHFLHAILKYLKDEQRLNLSFGDNLPIQDFYKDTGFPLFGEPVPAELRREFCERSLFHEGELVAVFDLEEQWIYARVLEVDETSISYCTLDKGALLPRVCSALHRWVRKLRSFPSLPRRELSCERLLDEQYDPSVSSLMLELTSRPIHFYQIPPQWAYSPALKIMPKEGYNTRDELRLLKVLDIHNHIFQERFKIGIGSQGPILGLLEEKYVTSGSKIYVCGDLHGNATALISVLRHFKELHLLDDQYKCVPGFYMVFLGDYIDRGVNDILLLTLLLLLRIENPDSVILLRGNHETLDPGIHAPFCEAESTLFLAKNPDLCLRCFDSFPLALLMASQDVYQKGEAVFQHQYVHFSHGLLSLSMDFSSMLQGQNGLVPVSVEGVFPPSWLTQEKRRVHAVQSLFTLFHSQSSALTPLNYIWGDIDSSSHPSSRGIGYAFSPEAIDLVRKASETNRVKVAFFIRGHQHLFREHLIERKPGSGKKRYKVIATTLPINSFPIDGSKINQGMLLTVAPRVKDWKKMPFSVERNIGIGKFLFSLESVDRTLYEELVPQSLPVLPPTMGDPVQQEVARLMSNPLFKTPL